ncbi:MAG: DUF4327 family protein [Cyanobacteria bacterium J06627_28]
MLKTFRQYSIQVIQDEARALVIRGFLGKKTQIHSLSRYFDPEDWQSVERVLEANEFLLRDSVCDLIGKEVWSND